MPAFLPLGVSAVTFTAIDAAGNVGTASATIELRLPWPGSPRRRAAPPVARVPPANVAGLRARPLAGAVQLEWRAAANASRYVVMRSDRAGASNVVYDGRATTFVDRGLFDGEEYRYVVVTYDAAGLRSVGVAVVAVPAQPVLSTPRHGAAVSRPPLLTWRSVQGATYYNAQLLRIAADGSSTKVLSVWPLKNRFQLSRTWRYAGKTQRLSAGTYEWFVWAGLGSRAAQNYSPLLGWSRFTLSPQRVSRLGLAYRDDVERCDGALEARERQSPTGSTSTSSSTSAYSRCAIRISPPVAWSASREARFVTAPIAA